MSGEARSARTDGAGRPDPYRVLFPFGVLFGMVGAALWPLHALRLIPYPAPVHWTLMIQGFEHCFILGFLLTAMPAFLHAERVRASELWTAAGAMIVVLVATLAGRPVVAQASYLLTIATLAVVGARRFRRVEPPPEEFLLVAVGLLLGIAGGVLSLLAAAGAIVEPVPRFGLRLISLGTVLSLVLGVGGLLVPTFSAMREPLVIPGLARPHERRPRRILYSTIAASLIAALVLEGLGRPIAGAWTRAVAGTTVLLWVWKIWRVPKARDLVAYSLWTAGWMILVGLWMAAILPLRPLMAYHFIFIGGFGALTLGIATRVIVRHGRHPITAERTVLRWGILGSLALALVARVAAETAPAQYLALLGVSGALWILAWTAWLGGALRYVLHVAQPSPAGLRAGPARQS